LFAQAIADARDIIDFFQMMNRVDHALQLALRKQPAG
jgi:hypothetical protein